MSAGERLRTGRQVFIRRLTDDDRDEFIRRAAESREFHDPWVFLPTTPERFAAYRSRFDGTTAEGFLVCTLDTHALAGFINVSNIIRGPYQRATLGYGAFLPHAGKGHLSEGLRLVIGYCFTTLGLHRLEADIQPANESSKTFVHRHGFRKEGYSPSFALVNGTWKDHERWALTAPA
ncbi:GNAT family N-acetyltransferase [Thermomonospora amylolytica]|uniref:GNAT family N-acetyltransferase n=1 Tax=Thermomonospora amylolytica TaxID=1411117 RepID=UPI001F43D011|nr:GNAT family N-acetyltransferase [Thermomonospora amylolytica]